MLQPKDTGFVNGYKNKTHIYAVYKTPTSDLETHTDWKVRGWKKILHANGNQKKAGVAILISDKIDFKIKTVTRDKEGHYIIIKGSIQEDVTIINIYAPNIRAPQYIRQMLTAIEEEIDGPPLWHSGQESSCQCSGHGFNPWAGKIPHAAEQLSPCATTTEPVL